MKTNRLKKLLLLDILKAEWGCFWKTPFQKIRFRCCEEVKRTTKSKMLKISDCVIIRVAKI